MCPNSQFIPEQDHVLTVYICIQSGFVPYMERRSTDGNLTEEEDEKLFKLKEERNPQEFHSYYC